MPSEDNRDYRIQLDLNFPTDKSGAINGMLNHILNQFPDAVNIGPKETGFIRVQRCGHRLGIPCSVTDEWEVGKGKIT